MMKYPLKQSMEERAYDFQEKWMPLNPPNKDEGTFEYDSRMMSAFAEKESLDRAIEELEKCKDEFSNLVKVPIKGNDAVDRVLMACSEFINRHIAELKAAQKGEVKR